MTSSLYLKESSQPEKPLVLNAGCVGSIDVCTPERRGRWGRAIKPVLIIDSARAAACSRTFRARLGKRRQGSCEVPGAPFRWANCSRGFYNQRDLVPSYMEKSLPGAASRKGPSVPSTHLKQFKFWLMFFLCIACLSFPCFPQTFISADKPVFWEAWYGTDKLLYALQVDFLGSPHPVKL